jgi:putative phosphonate metabolism protein
MPERFALYYAPAAASPLWVRAAAWLGRDPAAGPVEPADVPGIETAYRMRVTESARRYGFHATIKAPMALAPGLERRDLEAALAAYGDRTAPVGIGRLVPRFIDGFLALVPAHQGEALAAVAGEVVTAFDGFRAPLTVADRARRLRGGGLTPRQADLLDRYGYPYVLEQFRFHMTLTDRLPEDERDAVMAAAEGWFADALAGAFELDRIALFREPVAGAPFARVGDFLLEAEVAVDA